MAAPVPIEGAIPTEQPRPVPLEIAVFSKEDALAALSHGAKRIELNANGSYDLGGLTPDVEAFKSLVTDSRFDNNYPIRIMIRPRVVDYAPEFIYSYLDFCLMDDAIKAFKATGLLNPVRGDAFVFGMLGMSDTPASGRFKVNHDRCKILVNRAQPYQCVFHRAFDPIAASDDWKRGIDDIMSCGFTGILTSGGYGNYLDNLDRIGEICDYVARRIQIVVGGGVRAAHVKEAVKALKLDEKVSFRKNLSRELTDNIWMHSSCLTKQPDPNSAQLLDPQELLNLVNELGLDVVD